MFSIFCLHVTDIIDTVYFNVKEYILNIVMLKRQTIIHYESVTKLFVKTIPF